jgi:hypothetical protein
MFLHTTNSDFVLLAPGNKLARFTPFTELLKQWAATVNLKRFASSPRGEKKPKPQRNREPNRPHVSTARLLAEKQRSQRTSTFEKQRPDVVETPASQALQL